MNKGITLSMIAFAVLLSWPAISGGADLKESRQTPVTDHYRFIHTRPLCLLSFNN